MRNGIENLCGLFKEDSTKKKWKIVQKIEELENRGKITPKRQKNICKNKDNMKECKGKIEFDKIIKELISRLRQDIFLFLLVIEISISSHGMLGIYFAFSLISLQRRCLFICKWCTQWYKYM